MRLLAFMKLHGLSDKAMADRIGECSDRQVRKWKYGERTPRLPELLRIGSATDGAVQPSDFCVRRQTAKKTAIAGAA